jgi:hypothetical protein
MLNVTEHRKNWFELPEVFRFAEQRQLYLHINTCIHPHNVTLYTLPASQLRYVLSSLEYQRAALLADYPKLSNRASYDFLLSLIRSELDSRAPIWQPVLSNLNVDSDGALAAPRPGLKPYDTPTALLGEVDRMVRMLDESTARRMLTDVLERTLTLPATGGWQAVAGKIESLLKTLPATSVTNVE